MRKLLLVGVIIGISILGAQAQISRAVLWSATDPKCGPQTGLAPAESVACDAVVVDGNTIAVLLHNGLILAGSYIEQGDYIAVDAFVSNKTGHRILVDPAYWSVLNYNSQDDHAKGKNAVIAGPVSAQTIADKFESRIRWANALAGVGAAFQTQTATATATSSTGQTAQATATSPDYAAQARVAAANSARSADAATQARQIASKGLYANTVFDQGTVSGMVYFKRDKHAKVVILRAVIEGTMYLFELKG